MTSRRFISLTLAALIAAGSMPLLAQQAGTLAGNASKEFDGPYSDHAVQIRDAATGQIVQTVQPTQTGDFSFSNLEMNQRYIVELFNTVESEVLCTEGPFQLTSTNMPSRTDVEINCGKKALWLLLAAPAIGLIAARSPSGL
jgi:hypothetical protein